MIVALDHFYFPGNPIGILLGKARSEFLVSLHFVCLCVAICFLLSEFLIVFWCLDGQPEP